MTEEWVFGRERRSVFAGLGLTRGGRRVLKGGEENGGESGGFDRRWKGPGRRRR